MIVALHNSRGVELLSVDSQRSRDLRPEAIAFLRLLPASDLAALVRGDGARARALAAQFCAALDPAPTPPPRP